MALETNLVHSWNLDESSGNLSDNKGSATLTNNNTTTFGAGKINNGGIFNGSNQGFTKAASSIGIANAWTIAGWIKTTDGGASDKMLHFRPASGDSNEIRFQLSGDGNHKLEVLCMHYAGSGSGYKSYEGGTTISNDTWYFAAATWDGTYLILYLNGSAETLTKNVDGTVTMNDTAANRNWGLGSSGDGTNSFWYGMIDTVNVWSRAITAEEVTSLYNSGNGMYFNGTIFVTGAVANTTNFFNFM